MTKSPTFIKSIVESTLTGINGPIRDLELDKITSIGNNVSVEGSFSTTFNYRKFKFSLEIDENGNILTYNKNELKSF